VTWNICNLCRCVSFSFLFVLQSRYCPHHQRVRRCMLYQFLESYQPPCFPCTYSHEGKGSTPPRLLTASSVAVQGLALGIVWTEVLFIFLFFIIHLTVAVAGSNPSNSNLVQCVRITVIDKISINCLIKLSLRITVPTLVDLTSISKICCRITV